jgi:hypothetical protein
MISAQAWLNQHSLRVIAGEISLTHDSAALSPET